MRPGGRPMRPWAVALLVTVLWVLATPMVAYVYLRYGHPPVAVSDPAFPYEAQIVHVPLSARVDREMPAHSAVPINEATLTDGARVYQQHCANCHGVPNHPSPMAKMVYPGAPQLWVRHGDHVGVSDDPVGETYWKVKNGIRLCAMPSYQKVLSETEMWEVSNLVSVADKPLPASAQLYLRQ